jgi:DivIVA domain-containing protein
VTSQGQRFRRRSLRRGYKVEEVDTFLDRVEATLNGAPVDQPVRSKEVHDVVFRVKFGGYDEWQVDLHLDRVERQLAEREPEQPHGVGPERMPDRMAMGMPGRDDRMGGGERSFDRPSVPGGPMPGAGVPVAGMPSPGMSPMPARPGSQSPPPGFSRYDEPPGRDQHDQPFGPPPGGFPPPPGYRPAAGPGGPPPGGGQTYGGGPGFGRGPERPDQPRPGYGPNERNIHADRTAEMRVPPGGQPGPGGPGAGPRDSGPIGRPAGPGAPRDGGPPREGGLPPRDTGSFGGPGMSAPPRPGATGGFAAPDAPGQGGFTPPAPAGPPMSPEMQRVDQLRRTFQPRRFGSGYDRAAVDDLFEGILATLAGRAARPVGDADLDAHRFNLVPGGYYEDEVDDALRQARDILRRR